MGFQSVWQVSEGMTSVVSHEPRQFAALHFAEKLWFWVAQRFSAAVNALLSAKALAAEVAESSFSANCLAAEGFDWRLFCLDNQ